MFSAILRTVAEDVDGDGSLNIVASGNDYGTEPSVNCRDTNKGLVLKGHGKGGFTPLGILQSGCLSWAMQSTGEMKMQTEQPMIATNQNHDPLKLFSLKEKQTLFPQRQQMSAPYCM